jgi:FAD/FMN-containing dehydrogenase
MNKIAVYLNEHLLGDVASSKAIRRRFSRDGSVLTVTPEIIVFPRVTNDIRKVARFSWQLAEKGHPLSLTPRGLGGDQTGAAIGKGIVISTGTHLNKIIHLAPKERLVHVQPGASINQVQAALKWQGLSLPNVPAGYDATAGGLLANNSLGSYGSVADAIEKIEVVLANGDMIEVGRVSRRDLTKKLGLQTFEGEIYRKLEGLVEDNEALLSKIAGDKVRDNAGYKGIASIRAKDGSFDLTPLFIGSQGTLGIISEIVFKADFYSQDALEVVIMAETPELARDITDKVSALEPAALEIYDGELFRRASAAGAQFTLLGSTAGLGHVVYIKFNDFSGRAQAHKLKKLQKIIAKMNVTMVDSTKSQPEDFEAIASIGRTLELIAADDDVPLALLNGSFVPPNRREEFSRAVGELAKHHHLVMPLRHNALTGTFYAFPTLKLDVVSDKQKLFRLISDYAALVDKCGGAVVSDGSEGRLKANAAWSVMDPAEASLYEQLRAIFDPFRTLNPDVKQKNDVRHLVSSLRTSYDPTDFVS